jgi:hypothetical protein
MKMSVLSILVGVVIALGCAGCDGGGDGGGGGGGEDTLPAEVADEEAVEDSGGSGGVLWSPISGATKGDVTSVRGFEAENGALYLAVKSPVSAGLFYLDTAGDALEFTKIFEGTGLTIATEAGTYMALWEDKAGSLVQVSVEEEATDLAFNFEQREIQKMVFTDGLLYLLSKNWEKAEYHVNRGSAAAKQWDQLGGASNETTLGLHSDGDNVVVVTVRNETPLGLNCKSIPANAGEDDSWSDCPGFPQHLGAGPNDPYSVKAGISGDGTAMAVWFEILKQGQRTYEVQLGTMDGGWSVVGGLPDDKEPSDMLIANGTLFVAYLGKGDGRQVFTVGTEGGDAVLAGSGLPEPGHDKSGVVMLARGGGVYALFQEYNAGGSALTAYKLSD